MSVKIGCAVWTLMEPNYKAPMKMQFVKLQKPALKELS